MPKPRAYAMTHALGYVLDVITPEEHERSEGKYTLALYDQAAIDEAVKEERERCARICKDAKAAVWDFHDSDVKKAAENVCDNLAANIRGTVA